MPETHSDNNRVRILEDVLSLDVWRSTYDDTTDESKLYIDIFFHEEARIGGIRGDLESVVRFRLALRRAEVHVTIPSTERIKVLRSSITQQHLEEILDDAHAGDDTAPDSTLLQMNIAAENESVRNSESNTEYKKSEEAVEAVNTTEIDDDIQFDMVEREQSSRHIESYAYRTPSGYAFRIQPLNSYNLSGRPWNPNVPRMTIKRSPTEMIHPISSEVIISVRCRREDIIISDVEFTGGEGRFKIGELSANKRIMVEQILKQEIIKSGLPVGNISEQFEDVVIARMASGED